MNYRRSKSTAPASPSKRWQTTTASAMEETASKTGIERGVMVQDLQDRKLKNTKTSISFGHEKVNYVSDAMDSQRACQGVSPAERALQAERIKKMKDDLTVTNFKLGDEIPLYMSVNQESMAEADKFKITSRVESNNMLKEAIKKSSIAFGHEHPLYKSVAHESMEYRGSANDFTTMKNEVNDMKTSLRKHNFSFGDESVDYTSDYQRGYGSLPLEAYRYASDQKPHIHQVIEDSRRCHFILGHDQITYQSNTAAALKSVADKASGNDVAQNIERARAMKANLQKTSLVIGDDAEYM